MAGEWPAPTANGRQPHPTVTCNPSKCFRSHPFAACPTSLGSGAERREGSSPFSCTNLNSQGDLESSKESATRVDSGVDDCVDDSARGRLIASLNEGLRRMLAERDGDRQEVLSIVRHVHGILPENVSAPLPSARVLTGILWQCCSLSDSVKSCHVRSRTSRVVSSVPRIRSVQL